MEEAVVTRVYQAAEQSILREILIVGLGNLAKAARDP
jgi:hypothetical protein